MYTKTKKYNHGTVDWIKNWKVIIIHVILYSRSENKIENLRNHTVINRQKISWRCLKRSNWNNLRPSVTEFHRFEMQIENQSEFEFHQAKDILEVYQIQLMKMTNLEIFNVHLTEPKLEEKRCKKKSNLKVVPVAFQRTRKYTNSN